MAALLGLHQRVNLLWCLTFLLFIFPGASSLTVAGQIGGSITLPCNSSNREDFSTLLTFGPKIAYGFNQDKYYEDRVHESGSCDLILQDLKSTDAGKYISKVYASGQLPNIYTYDIHVYVTLTGQKGEELMFDDLPREAENVTHLTNASCTEVWRRGQGVLTDRLIDKNGCLTIKNFTSSDAGTYRVLNSTEEILVTVRVTEFRTESKDKLDSTHEDETLDTERVPVWGWILIGMVALVALIVFAAIMIRQRLNRNEDSYQEVQMTETVQGPRSPNNSNS